MMRLRSLFLALLGLIVAGAVFGYAGARQSPRTVRYTVEMPDWPAGQPPLRIVELTDIHGSRYDMPPSRIATIVDAANALHPDLIVLTGDYCCSKIFDSRLLPFADIVAQLARLRAPLGVLAVLGNHDTKAVTAPAFAAAGIRLLADDWVQVGPVTVAGIDDVSNLRNWHVTERELGARLPNGRPIILLGHEPNFFQRLPANVSLLIAGHTHGGQIMLPLIGTRHYDEFIDTHMRGHFAEHGQQMIVSSGLGTSVIPMRIGVRPEIVEITLRAPGQASGRKSGTDR